jgi:hypothetical protein
MAASTFRAAVLHFRQFIAREAELLGTFLSKSTLPLVYMRETTLEQLNGFRSNLVWLVLLTINGGLREFLALLTGITC